MRTRTLLIKPGALGDTILALPLVRALRLAGGEVHVMGRPEYWAVALQDGCASRALSLDLLDLAPLFDDGREIPADLAAFLRNYDRVIAFWQTGAQAFERGLRRAGVRDARVAAPFPEPGGLHAADHLLSAVPGLPRVDPVPRFIASEQDRRAAAAMLHPPYVVIHPSSGSPKKNWRRFAELLDPLSRALKMRVVVPLGPAETGGLDAFTDAFTDRTFQTDPAIVHEPPVRTLGALLAEAAVYVGNDSGVTHLAAAAGAPVVAIFGPTDPARWGPRGEPVRVLQARDAEMQTPEPEEALAAAREIAIR